MKRREFLALLAVGPFAGPMADTKVSSQQFKPTPEPVALGWALTPGNLRMIREWLESSGVRCSWSRDPIMGPNERGTCYVVKSWGPDRIELESCDRQPLHSEITRILMQWLERGRWRCVLWRVELCEETGLIGPKELIFEGRLPS